jgi:hypothetical protein
MVSSSALRGRTYSYISPRFKKTVTARSTRVRLWSSICSKARKAFRQVMSSAPSRRLCVSKNPLPSRREGSQSRNFKSDGRTRQKCVREIFASASRHPTALLPTPSPHRPNRLACNSPTRNGYSIRMRNCRRRSIVTTCSRRSAASMWSLRNLQLELPQAIASNRC